MNNNENEPVLKASTLIEYRRSIGQIQDFQSPHTVIFVMQKSLADYIVRQHRTKRINGFVGDFHLLSGTAGKVGVSYGFGIGAPVIAGLTDEFAALGVQNFILVGMAGGLQPELTAGSLIISARAIRGEGVSRHYLPPGQIVESSPDLVAGLAKIFDDENHAYKIGETWTTDAPFRELRKDVIDFQKRGVLAVDMEATAMLAVARSMKLPAVSLFAIADQLSGGNWRMEEDLKSTRAGLRILFDASLKYFTSL